MYHLFASAVSGVGILASVLALLGERFKWGSFAQFSVATKVPVEVFCLSGPIVMLTVFLYAIFAFLLATERATGTVFYISASWAIIFLDMSVSLYKDWKDMFRRAIDLSLHSVNLTVVVYSLAHMPYVPTTFLVITFGCWGCLVMSRLVKRFFEKHRPRLPSRELQRPPPESSGGASATKER